jgi:DNA repair exonuclease SbcCD ATPase subunit
LLGAGVLALVATLVAGGAFRVLLPALGLILVIAGGFGIWRRGERNRVWEERQSEAEARRNRIAGMIDEQLEGVPRGETLSTESAADRSERFSAQIRARAELGRLRESIDELLSAIDAELPSQGELPLIQDAQPEEFERAVAVAPILDHEVSRARTELAKRSIELDRSEAVTIKLPDGLEPSYAAVRAALDGRRTEYRDVSVRFAELRRRLLEADTGESPLALDEDVDALREREAGLRSEVEALRAAFELLTDAYSEFRAGDQERLLDAVSAQLERVSGGALGPVETDSVLEAAHVVVRGRQLPLASPPLSFGELHAVLLAVRLGAADFLAGSGHRAPLLIDEPFTYLDDERAAQVWDQLREVARERQTIITTQARRLLSHLDVEPDVLLEAPGVESSTSP